MNRTNEYEQIIINNDARRGLPFRFSLRSYYWLPTRTYGQSRPQDMSLLLFTVHNDIIEKKWLYHKKTKYDHINYEHLHERGCVSLSLTAPIYWRDE